MCLVAVLFCVLLQEAARTGGAARMGLAAETG